MYTFLSLAFSLSSIISRFLHAAVYTSISFFLIQCVDMPHTHTQFVYPFKHLGCLSFGAVAEKAVITFVYQSLYRHMLSISLE